MKHNSEQVDLGDVSVKTTDFKLEDNKLTITNGPLAKAIEKLLEEAAKKESTAADRTVHIKADVAW